MRPLRHLVLATVCAYALPCPALDADVVGRLASEDSEEKIAAIRQLAATADPHAARVLEALAGGALQIAGGRVVLVEGEQVLDAATGQPVHPAPLDREDVTVNNRVRRELGVALAAFRLLDPDRTARLAAAQALGRAATPAMAPLLARALQQERDPQIRALLELAHAEAMLQSPDPAARRDAVRALGASGSARVRSMLARLLDERVEPDQRVRSEAKSSIASIDARLAWGEIAGRLFSGVSLGSILLLAALGLAITYGVMGVINMAHGELLMIGAYAAYAVQGLFHRYLPRALDWYVVAAIPVAFLAAALAGVVMERTVIRFLYRRPLETLLATWGVSLVLIQAARLTFGAQNVTVANPAWMSGAVQPAENVVLPWNRIVIVGFALAVLSAVLLFLRRTRLGLFVRAVTQNRPMASCVGVSTRAVDTLAFALGSGIAGLGGLALSQIANVGPDMGQAYIVDSFMVVVLGGVGQLAGAVGAALGLGIAAKFLEGWAGAVIAKIAVLVFVIVFIQKRPQGLFAPRGRYADG
jgi:urea transport system permease protein